MTASQWKVLLVDDQPSVRQSLQRALVGHNLSVVAAANGQQAVEMLMAGGIDLVLLDWNIPNENGWEILDRLTSIDPVLPAIVMTARPDQITLAVKASVDSVLEKPLELSSVVATIERLLSTPRKTRVFGLNPADNDCHGQNPVSATAHTEDVKNNKSRTSRLTAGFRFARLVRQAFLARLGGSRLTTIQHQE